MNKTLRFRVLTRDKFTCRYCGAAAPSVALHVDHIMPKSKGGLDHHANLITACSDCNAGKRDIILDDELMAVIASKSELPAPPQRKQRKPRVYRPMPPTRKRLPPPPIPVALGAPYLAPDVPAPMWRCSECGFINTLEGDGCSCHRGSKSREYCRDCTNELSEWEESEYESLCEECYDNAYGPCRNCRGSDREEGSEYCEECNAELSSEERVAAGGYA